MDTDLQDVDKGSEWSNSQLLCKTGVSTGSWRTSLSRSNCGVALVIKSQCCWCVNKLLTASTDLTPQLNSLRHQYQLFLPSHGSIASQSLHNHQPLPPFTLGQFSSQCDRPQKTRAKSWNTQQGVNTGKLYRAPNHNKSHLKTSENDKRHIYDIIVQWHAVINKSRPGAGLETTYMRWQRPDMRWGEWLCFTHSS